VRSRFLICKHLVQAIQPVVFPPSKKESYATFLGTSNPHPRNTTSDNTSSTQIPSKHKDHQAADIDAESSDNDNDDEDEGEDNMVDAMTGTGVNDSGTFRERFEGAIATIREFCKGLVYQI
jgi:NAD(P)H-hydrate repair Nnr-like enzyme with NAD(P)H-hydrate epimerase domain